MHARLGPQDVRLLGMPSLSIAVLLLSTPYFTGHADTNVEDVFRNCRMPATTG
jgi:hypothetical protein